MPDVGQVTWSSFTDVASRNSFEMGVGLTLAAGRVAAGANSKTLVFVQTNNAGTAGSGDVVTAIDAATGTAAWQQGYAFTTALRTGGASIPSLTGIPGGDRPVEIPGAELIRGLVLKNQIMVGSVNAARDHFQMAVDDLTQARLRWGEHVTKLITARHAHGDFEAALHQHNAEDIKAVVEWGEG